MENHDKLINLLTDKHFDNALDALNFLIAAGYSEVESLKTAMELFPDKKVMFGNAMGLTYAKHGTFTGIALVFINEDTDVDFFNFCFSQNFEIGDMSKIKSIIIFEDSRITNYIIKLFTEVVSKNIRATHVNGFLSDRDGNQNYNNELVNELVSRFNQSYAAEGRVIPINYSGATIDEGYPIPRFQHTLRLSHDPNIVEINGDDAYDACDEEG